ncbi:SMI1/KNR4 family protein [Streptomyces sp. NPDC102364]|uniref:SMI1/KNR4 family protein n=1 Tax=Streptomyces sp. NPDC102364 TaxID=3366161 RepID=UPI0037FD8DE5
MMTADDRDFPDALAAALAVPFSYDAGDGVDFEPFPRFLSVDETADWIHAWTGNPELTGVDFRVFGQNGAGGYAAFWLVRHDEDLAGQPIVFLGSEGETAVVARDLADFLWLLAGGYGPFEALPDFTDAYEPDWRPRLSPERAAIAERFARQSRRSPADVIKLATQEFPDFENTIDQLCR